MPDNDLKSMATVKIFLNRLHDLCGSGVLQFLNVSFPTSKNPFYYSLMSIDLRISGGFCVHTRSNMIN